MLASVRPALQPATTRRKIRQCKLFRPYSAKLGGKIPKLYVAGSNPVACSKRKLIAERKLERTCRREAVRARTQRIRKSSGFGKAPAHGPACNGAPPSYRLHKQSGQAIVSLPRADGTY